MEIVEWYEFVGRIADIKFGKDPATKDWPLAKKIEEILDDLFTGYKLKKNEVEIEIEEFSESDDEY